MYLSSMTVAQSAQPSSSDITVTLKRLVVLLEEDETDEYGILQPKKMWRRSTEKDVET